MSAEKSKKKQKNSKGPPQLMEEDTYSLVMSREEILSSIQILSFAKGVFEQMAINSEKEDDAKSTAAWAARAKLALLLSAKLHDVAKIGEPTSREVH